MAFFFVFFCYMESSFSSSRTRRGYFRRPYPRVRPRGHITQRARGEPEIFKQCHFKRVQVPKLRPNYWYSCVTSCSDSFGELRHMMGRIHRLGSGGHWHPMTRGTAGPRLRSEAHDGPQRESQRPRLVKG